MLKKQQQQLYKCVIDFCYMKPKSETGGDDEVKEVLTIGSQLVKGG